VTASAGTRAERLGDEGARKVKDEDAARRDYLKRFYGVDEESPTHYDLVINTDVLSVEQAADLVSQASSR
jgi:cytidylate kinase